MLYSRASEPHADIDSTAVYFKEALASPNNGELDYVLVLPGIPSAPPTKTDPDEWKVIGRAGVWDETLGQIAIMLHPDYWGRGYITEVLEVLVPVLWRKGLEKLHAHVHPQNIASLRALKRAGFEEKQSLVMHNEWCWKEGLCLELVRPQHPESGHKDFGVVVKAGD